jgi:cyclophilin family peptidyl-prolyl cis-trans isomerase
MKRTLSIALLAVALAACSHPASQDSATNTSGTSAVTGIPAHYRRAYPVALPVSFPAATYATNPAPGTAAPASAPAALSGSAVNAGMAGTTPASVPATTSTYSSVPAPAVPAATTNMAPFVAPSAGLPVPNATPEAFDANQVVVIETSFGRLVIQLDDFAAPKTCANFRKLVSAGFYDGVLFHRVIPKFIIQGGDPNTKSPDHAAYGLGDPGYTLPPEIKELHDRGAVAMARLPDSVNPQRYSNGSQFYICLVPCPTLDNQYTVFGHVISGMDVADRISAQPRDKRDDPLERIDLKATLEPRDQALRENASAGPGP